MGYGERDKKENKKALEPWVNHWEKSVRSEKHRHWVTVGGYEGRNVGCGRGWAPAPRDMWPLRWEKLYVVRIQAGVVGRGDGGQPLCPRQARTLELIPEGSGASMSIFPRQENTMLRFVVCERSF